MYNQEVKKESRELLIRHAVEALTTERANSFLVTKDHFTKITDHFNSLFFQCLGSEYFQFKNQYTWQFHGAKGSWFNFYDSFCKPKEPAELKVLYLSGPEPLNDIEVFCDNGIIYENIWAIESEKAEYTKAVKSLVDAGVEIKLHRGNLEEFFELTNHEFDIVYFDACSPIISPKNLPLEILKQIFINKRLTNLSVLITNFAEPRSNYNWGEILGCWFSSKYEIEVPKVDCTVGMDCLTKSLEFTKYSAIVNEHLHEYYDTFITHFIPCFASEIIPSWQFVSLSSIQNDYLLNEQKLFQTLNKIRAVEPQSTSIREFLTQVPHFQLAVDAYPLLNWARFIREILPDDHTLNRFLQNKRRKVSLEDALYIINLLKRIEETESGFNTLILEICSSRLQEVLAKLDFFDRPLGISCDIPMKNLLVELFIGLYGYPFIANAEKSLSLKYKAKETWMFSNVFVFDQCRYLYDFLPTVDLLESFFDKLHNQTIIRGCIDGIHRNHFSLNQNLFKWGFIEGIYDEFSYGKLRERINLNESMNE